MPDRVIRDEIRNSDTILGLKRNTHRLAFVACVLEADDLGNFEAGPGALWRLWRDWLSLTDRQQVAEILLALTDADLVRLYETDGKRFAHIPKFRQRLRYIKGKHPRPPRSIECKEINILLEKSQTEVRLKSDRGQTVDARSEVKRSEEKRSEENLNPARATKPVDKSPRPHVHITTPKPDGDKSPNNQPNVPPPVRVASDEAGIEALARFFGKWPLSGDAGRDWNIALRYVNGLREAYFRGQVA